MANCAGPTTGAGASTSPAPSIGADGAQRAAGRGMLIVPRSTTAPPISPPASRQAGHWAADAMLFSTPGQAILIAHERHSRITTALRQSSLHADPVAAAHVGRLKAMPADLRCRINTDHATQSNPYKRNTSRPGTHAT